MICGGVGEILIDFIDVGDANNLRVYAEAADIVKHGKRGWLITILGNPADDGGLRRQQCLVKPDRSLVGEIDCAPYLLEKLIAGPVRVTLHSEIFDDQRFLVEPLREGGTVYIFGAGHVSQKIAPLSESVASKLLSWTTAQISPAMSDFPNPSNPE